MILAVFLIASAEIGQLTFGKHIGGVRVRAFGIDGELRGALGGSQVDDR